MTSKDQPRSSFRPILGERHSGVRYKRSDCAGHEKLEREQPTLSEMSSIDGVDFFFFENPDSGAPGSAGVRAKQDEMLVAIRKHGKHAGIIAESDQAP